MTEAVICDGVRTPIGRYGGALAAVRTDDLAAIPIRALMERNPTLAPDRIDEVLLGDANQAGEDNRNVARMAALLAGLPVTVPGITLNRLCASGMDAVGFAARGIKAGDYAVTIAGGVESMTRAPFVMPKPGAAWSRGRPKSTTRPSAGASSTRRWRRPTAPTPCPRPPTTWPRLRHLPRRSGRLRRCAARNAGPGRCGRRLRRRDRAGDASRNARATRPSSTATNTRGPAPPPRRWPSCAASTGRQVGDGGQCLGRQ
jgi:hypothetical protein